MRGFPFFPRTWQSVAYLTIFKSRKVPYRLTNSIALAIVPQQKFWALKVTSDSSIYFSQPDHYLFRCQQRDIRRARVEPSLFLLT